MTKGATVTQPPCDFEVSDAIAGGRNCDAGGQLIWLEHCGTDDCLHHTEKSQAILRPFGPHKRSNPAE